MSSQEHPAMKLGRDSRRGDAPVPRTRTSYSGAISSILDESVRDAGGDLKSKNKWTERKGHERYEWELGAEATKM